jgi:hypothetical protein
MFRFYAYVFEPSRSPVEIGMKDGDEKMLYETILPPRCSHPRCIYRDENNRSNYYPAVHTCVDDCCRADRPSLTRPQTKMQEKWCSLIVLASRAVSNVSNIDCSRCLPTIFMRRFGF